MRKLSYLALRRRPTLSISISRMDLDYEVVAFTVDAAYVDKDEHRARPLVAFEGLQSRFPPDDHDLFVAIGFQKMNAVRAKKFAEAKSMGYRLASYLSSKASAWPEFSAAENTFVMEDNTIQPFVDIGPDTILWSGNHVGHHSTIGAHCGFVVSCCYLREGESRRL